jgi:hypothetical protein
LQVKQQIQLPLDLSQHAFLERTGLLVFIKVGLSVEGKSVNNLITQLISSVYGRFLG